MMPTIVQHCGSGTPLRLPLGGGAAIFCKLPFSSSLPRADAVASSPMASGHVPLAPILVCSLADPDLTTDLTNRGASSDRILKIRPVQ